MWKIFISQQMEIRFARKSFVSWLYIYQDLCLFKHLSKAALNKPHTYLSANLLSLSVSWVVKNISACFVLYYSPACVYGSYMWLISVTQSRTGNTKPQVEQVLKTHSPPVFPQNTVTVSHFIAPSPPHYISIITLIFWDSDEHVAFRAVPLCSWHNLYVNVCILSPSSLRGEGCSVTFFCFCSGLKNVEHSLLSTNGKVEPCQCASETPIKPYVYVGAAIRKCAFSCR